jgi:hypothetical protein
MLGKLFKHEWKATWKLMVIMNAAVIVLSALGVVFFYRNSSAVKPLFDSLERNDNGDTLYMLACMGYLMLLVLSICVLAVGCTIYFYIRFYRNLYTDQGYLMHTLPVTEHQLILSKTFVCIIWRIISALVVLTAILVLMSSAFGEDFMLMDLLEELNKAFFDMGMFKGVIFMIILIFGMLGKALFTTFTGYTCISIGQLASKNKVLAAIGVYFGMRVIMQIISTFGSQYLAIIGMMAPDMWFEIFENNENAMIVFFAVAVVVEYLICGAMYMITHSVMQKRLNLE